MLALFHIGKLRLSGVEYSDLSLLDSSDQESDRFLGHITNAFRQTQMDDFDFVKYASKDGSAMVVEKPMAKANR